jgi:hypothetical protein
MSPASNCDYCTGSDMGETSADCLPGDAEHHPDEMVKEPKDAEYSE